ncbi:MAG: hypothetical protein CMP23_13040 [Rickettsiales bacterium]|nr:hypothetical protein [Rickettsiales bacterium]
MARDVPIHYDDLFAFLEDYRTAIRSSQYTIPTPEPVQRGDDVALRLTAPLLEGTVTLNGRVIAPMGEHAGVQLDLSEGDGPAQLEAFYRMVGTLVEHMLRSGRFQVTGQWAEGAVPMVPATAAAAVATAPGPPRDSRGAGGMGVPDSASLGEAARSGELSLDGMTALLMDLYGEKASGILEINSEQGRRVGFLHKGGLVQWLSDPVIEDECLGVLLTNANKLSPDQLRQSLEMMSDTGNLQGECFIELGFLTFPQVVMSLMTQVEIISRNVFTATEGTYRFYPREKLPTSYPNPPMKSPGFLFAFFKRAYASMPASEVELEYKSLLDQYSLLSSGISLDDLRLKKEERALIEILSAKSYRFREIFSVSSMGRSQTLQALMALLRLGILEFVEQEDTEQILSRISTQLARKVMYQQNQHEFDLLEVHWTSCTPQVEEGYQKIRAEYEGIGRGLTLPAETEAHRQEILSNIERAYAALKEPRSRKQVRAQHYEPQQHEANAELMSKKAEMLIVRGAWADVIDNYERAIELMPKVGKYHRDLEKARGLAAAGGYQG